MMKLMTIPPNIQNNPLLKKIPTKSRHEKLPGITKKTGNPIERYKIKISLESIHYTGKNYGYGWTFVISTLNHHWISNRIQVQRGAKSLVNRDVYNDTVDTTFDNLQHLPIELCAHHTSGFKAETIMYLKPNSFKRNLIPKSIYIEVENKSEKFNFHEIQTVTQDDTQLMFVLNFEITPNASH